MGRVISIEDWRARRGDVPAPPARTRSDAHPAEAKSQVETELLAVSGAVSMQMYVEAAIRVERLTRRLATVPRGDPSETG